MGESAVDVSVLLPAYNEEATLAATVRETLDALAALDLPNGYEVIVAEDGCTDETPAVAARLAAEHAAVRHLHSDDRLGRGRALNRALGAVRGEVVVYFDTDLATDLAGLGPLVEAIRTDGYDVATGSRLLPDSVADRPAGRDVPSRVYNRLVRWLLGSTVHDHQCGFKAFDREVLEGLVGAVAADHWFWDTEVLVLAQRRGFRVAEIPVVWTARDDSTVDVPRDALRMGGQLLGLTWRLRLAPALRRGRHAVALALTLAVGYLLLDLVADPALVLDHIAEADPRALALAGGIYLLSWPVRGVRYRDILDELGYRERVGVLTGAIFVSQTGNLLVPARAGDAIRAYIVNVRRNVPYTTGFASLAVERIFDLLTITLLAGGVLIGLLATRGRGPLDDIVRDPGVGGGALAVGIALGVAAAVLAGFAILLLTSRFEGPVPGSSLVDREGRLGRAVGALSRFLLEVRAVSTRPRAVVAIGATSVAVWSLDVLTAVAVLAAFDVAVGAGALLAVGFFAVSVGNLAKIVPVSPGGIGLYEAGFAVLVVGLTAVPVSVAIAAAIVDHALKNLITGAGGLASMALLNVSLVTAAREGRAHVGAGPSPPE